MKVRKFLFFFVLKFLTLEFSVDNNPDMCLVGCVIHIFDHERFATDKLDLSLISMAVRLHGGDVEIGQKTCTAGRIVFCFFPSRNCVYPRIFYSEMTRVFV